MREKVKPALPEPNPFDEAERLTDADPAAPSHKVDRGPEPGPPVHGIGQVTVTWPEQVIQPIQYNGFRVGPITMTSAVLPGETPREAYARVWRILDDLAKDQFAAALENFIKNAKTAGQAVRSRASGS